MIKAIIDFSLRKPILNHFILVFIFILAIFSYLKIPKELFPPANLDMVSIRGTYIGASSDLLDKIAVEDIESELLSLDSVNKVSSVIKNGWFSIYSELKRGEDSNLVVDDVKDVITKIKSNLPSDMDEPTVKAMKLAFPLINVSIYSKDNSHSKEYLLDIADDLKRKISKLKDLTKVSVLGKSDKQLLIVFNEAKIEALGLSNFSVINTVQNLSSIFPIGIIKEKDKHYYLSTFNGEKDIDNIRNTILKIDNKKVLLKDIAKVDYKLEETSDTSHFKAMPNVAIGIRKGVTGDAIELVKQIKNITSQFQKKYQDLSFDTYMDTSVWIKNRLNTVVSNILFGLLLLFVALLLFINLRIAIIIAIGIPTSFMIGLVGLDLMGFSLNMLSLLGVLIALGMIVDEAIVVGENIYRHLEMGKDKFTAAIDGAMEMYPAVLAATATTVFAFLPILMMGGQTGKFMQILPIMISILLVSS
ncbi:MAG: efflux RND transporter permease subunit, partial [Arcobacter sp.]|nr:efflux RND transporter permease subunit [Arcobacter sp.]